MSQDACETCGRTGLEVTVTFDRHDPISIIRALREVVDAETLRVVANAELLR